MLVKGTKFYETASKKTFNQQDQTQLNRLASALAKETKAITIIQDAEVVELTDSQGEFKAISVKYQIGDRITRMIAPISEVLPDKTTLKSAHTYYAVPAESCVMKFTATDEECKYEIFERCKSLKGTGIQSGTSIMFDNVTISKSLEEGTKRLFKSSTSLTFKNNTISEF